MNVEENSLQKNILHEPKHILELLDRPLAQDALLENFKIVQEASEKTVKKDLHGLFFRIGMRWLTLRHYVVAQIAEVRKIHSLPHAKSQVLLGVINIQGQVALCVSLKKILDISDEDYSPSSEALNRIVPRIIVFEKDGRTWVFPVDEVEGMCTWDRAEVENIPTTIEHSESNFYSGLVRWNDQNVYVINDDVLFQYLVKHVY